MIPIQLEISNFLSYRTTAVLDFRGIHLACISGANGAGKSSILDSITWALFGQSRSKSDDDLVNRAAARHDETAEVRLTFRLGESVYRITRQKRVGRTAVLELQIATQFDDTQQPSHWKTLSESKLRETQSAIESLLRMNYDSFINASFLLQGKADEFTTKSPARRKEILAELLDIGIWDQLKEKVTIRRKEEESNLVRIESKLEEIDKELAEEEQRQAELAAETAKRDQLAQQLELEQTRMKEQEQLKAFIGQKEQEHQRLLRDIKQSEERLATFQANRTRRQEELKFQETLLSEADQIEQAYQQWQTHHQAVESWQAKSNEIAQLERRINPLQITISQTRARLQEQQQSLEQQAARAQTAVQTIAQLDGEMTKMQQEMSQLQTQLDALATEQKEAQTAQENLQRLQNKRSLWQQQLSQVQQAEQKVKESRNEQTDVLENIRGAKGELATLNEKLAQIPDLSRRHAELLADMNAREAEQQRLERELEKLRNRIRQLKQNDTSDCPVCGQPLTADHQARVLAETEANGKQLRAQFDANVTQIKQMQTAQEQVEKELKNRPFLERQQQTQLDRLARAEAKRETIEAELAEWEANGQQQLTQLQAQLADTTELDQLQQQLLASKTAVEQHQQLDTRRQTIQQRLVELRTQKQSEQQRLDEWESNGRSTLTTIQHDLENDLDSATERAALAELQAEKAAVGYDADAHQTAVAARQEVADASDRYQQLQQAATQKTTLLSMIADHDADIKFYTQEISSKREQAATIEAELSELKKGQGDLRGLEKRVADLRTELVNANQAVGRAEQRLSVLDDQRQRQERLQAEKTELRRLLQRLKLVEEACGRDGVQGLLIEAAIPEIEERANDLLERLTSGGMRVMFNTQRQLKSRKGSRETLDIQIIDGAGERPYDNYSGGEQFRVNFAIRLALSQILARRAGAKLQTLVIDEGFGSQDPNGRQRLIEAINTIQPDFERILVITHIDELREAFPSRIEVSKTVEGSTIEVS